VHVAAVVKVTQISHVVTETVDHLDDSCHGSDCANVVSPPEVDCDDRLKPEVMRDRKVSWRPHQQCVITPQRRDVITGNKMAAVNYRRNSLITSL